jgi:predicted DNA-binding ribbon-helix-helix protein
MSFLQQKLLMPTKHAEELAFLAEVLKALAEGRTQDANLACMARVMALERLSAPQLVDYTQEAA